MKKMNLALGLALGLAMSAAGAARAADLPRNSAPYFSAPAAGFNWSGGYVGANVGYNWGKITNTGTNPSGLEGGLQGGYNWQNGQFVYGAETDLQLSGADDTFAPFKFSNPWFGTLRGRGGFAYSNFLFYLTAGLAYGGLKAENGLLTESKTHIGWTAGVGAEVGITSNWSAKAEYLYMDLGSRSYSLTGTTNGYQANMIRLGVNYHF
jgi:outer membrane immunogenic protein